eukprot:6086690-Amphidinium_carterae.1
MPFFESGSSLSSRRRSLWAHFWHYVYFLPFWGSGLLFAVRPRRSYAEILATAIPTAESLENRRRRERLLFYYLADVTNPDHYPWDSTLLGRGLCQQPLYVGYQLYAW